MWPVFVVGSPFAAQLPCATVYQYMPVLRTSAPSKNHLFASTWRGYEMLGTEAQGYIQIRCLHPTMASAVIVVVYGV